MITAPRMIETHNRQGKLIFTMIDADNNLLYRSNPTSMKKIAKGVGASVPSCYRAMKELYNHNLIINMKERDLNVQA